MLRGRRPSLGSHTNSHDDDDDKCDTIEYVTVANDPAVAVSNVTAVLNGEERRETFAVPTCEHSQPWPVTIWIDADTRTVKLKTKTEMTGTRSSSRVWDQRKSPDSVRGGVSQLQTAVTESTLHQAIRSVKAVSNAKERVLQAVMLKWKVVAEHH